MDRLYSPSIIRRIREKHKFSFSKGLGQNFLADGNMVNAIIEGAGICPGDLVLEIGPGMGVMTAAAAEIADRVVSVEIDESLIPILEETLAEYDNVTIVSGDFMKMSPEKLLEDALRDTDKNITGVKVIGNLPYYITTPIIMKLLEERPRGKIQYDSITIMLQKEVAERIMSPPGSRVYGALSVAVQYYCRVKLLRIVPSEVFIPRPKVDSAVIRLDLRREPPVEVKSEKTLFVVIRAGFSQRRKTLLNALTGLKGKDKGEIKLLLEKAGIDPNRRAETLSLQEFASIANLWGD
ncbi:MAG: 16S rRNA (adenine(1518)-N(6)/adenine(1519)-N(6))-dimethyltransferase RsmA [Anaerovoracaceae bacterium]|jgi:16S rRNA (adenine1518-N6/adenine1519-N6)-dimethyltransferase